MNIWEKCRERISLIPLQHELLRVVESQEQVATNSLVDDLAEQALLEQMLETTKPVLPAGSAKLHYLLQTPFRYPPLRHGSRFGSRFEPGLFYGSHTARTVFAETAYYRFLFWSGMRVAPVSQHFVTQHTLFTVQYRTEKGIRLQAPPFDEYRALLANPREYAECQQLGLAMRQAGVEAFEYVSARDQQGGINAALFTARALSSSQPLLQQAWLADSSAETVSFYSMESGEVYHYPRSQFLVNDSLPSPAI